MMSFVNLHNHSEYSALDGMLGMRDLVGFAKEHDQPRVVLGDVIAQLFETVLDLDAVPIEQEDLVARGTVLGHIAQEASVEVVTGLAQ